jgi:hypothetical protein
MNKLLARLVEEEKDFSGAPRATGVAGGSMQPLLNLPIRIPHEARPHRD